MLRATSAMSILKHRMKSVYTLSAVHTLSARPLTLYEPLLQKGTQEAEVSDPSLRVLLPGGQSVQVLMFCCCL